MMKMKMKMKNRSHRYDINRPKTRDNKCKNCLNKKVLLIKKACIYNVFAKSSLLAWVQGTWKRSF